MQKKSDQTRLSVSETVKKLLSSIENELPAAKCRLDRFVEVFEKEFSLNIKPEDRGAAEAITWALMDSPLLLYSLNMNGSAIVELHGVLERFALRDTANHLGVPLKIFDRHHLSDLALVLHDLGIFDKDDVKFARKLNRLRNGLAHKNPRVISNMIYSGRKISALDIDSVMAKYDCIPLLIGTIHLMIKMSKAELLHGKKARTKL